MPSTCGLEFEKFFIELGEKKQVVSLVIFDTASNERYRTIRNSMNNRFQVFLLVYSVEERNSF